MPKERTRRALVLVTVLAECLLGFATYEAVAITFAVPEVAEREGFFDSEGWLIWLVCWSALRALAGILAVYATRPALWLLPLLVLLWELKAFTTNSAIVGKMFADLAPPLSLIWEFLFRVPIRSALIPLVVPIVLLPVLGLQAYWLFSSWRRRHAV